jgi:hypothetical protein
VLFRWQRDDVAAKLGRCGMQAGIAPWFCRDDIGRLCQRRDQCGKISAKKPRPSCMANRDNLAGKLSSCIFSD